MVPVLPIMRYLQRLHNRLFAGDWCIFTRYLLGVTKFRSENKFLWPTCSYVICSFENGNLEQSLGYWSDFFSQWDAQAQMHTNNDESNFCMTKSGERRSPMACSDYLILSFGSQLGWFYLNESLAIFPVYTSTHFLHRDF